MRRFGRRENARLAIARDDLSRVTDIAGEALGTHPDHRTPLGCVRALAESFHRYGANLIAAKRENDTMLAARVGRRCAISKAFGVKPGEQVDVAQADVLAKLAARDGAIFRAGFAAGYGSQYEPGMEAEALAAWRAREGQ